MDDLEEELDALERILCGQKEPDSLDFRLLRRLTGNFSDDRRIGEGGCGEVYKGELPNGKLIAVKKLKNAYTIDEKMFLCEVDSMIKVGHQNIVCFLGYCSETKEKALQIDGRTVMAEERERLLCFEYIRRGSIDNYLTDELRGFEWCTRYQIIKGICNGLLHLHKEKRILHMDLKPANILLSDQMVPKITDFGLSRIDGSSQTTSAQRLLSPVYCAPEYVENGKRSWKSDIYSLGVIMIELVTGSRQQVPNITKVLRRWRHRWSKSSKHIPIWYQQVKTCLELAVSCKDKNPMNRPFIWNVVRELKKLDSWDGEIRESSIEKIISSSDDMLGIEPLELDFTLAHHKKQISCSIELTNETDYYMAFRIATTSLLPFSIQPAKGIAGPRSKCTASITLSAQEMTRLHYHCKEEFVVQSTRIDGSLTDVDITDNLFNDEWGNSQKKVNDGDKVVDEVNLKVLFDKVLHEEHQKDVANLSAEMGSLVTSSQEVKKSVELSPHQDCGDLRVCAGCKNPIGHGRFLSRMGSVWHPECFRCYACFRPISEYEFAVHENHAYHRTCYKERFHPKCEVCSSIIPTNKNGLIEYRAHPFWRQKYCPSHENDGTPRCCSCERMEPKDSQYITLDDGRRICLECMQTATMENNECKQLYIDIQEFYEGMNIKVEQEVPLLLVVRQALNEAMKAEKCVHHLQTRALCLFEEQTVTTILKTPKIGPGNRIILITEPYRLTRRCEVTAVLILYGLPRLLTGSILVHEMMHVYFRLKGYPTLSPEVEEGICQVLAHLWLESQITSGPFAPSSYSSTSSWSRKGARTKFEKRLGEFFKYQIEIDSSVAYGDMFRAGMQAIERYGLRRTLDHIKMTRSYSPTNTSPWASNDEQDKQDTLLESSSWKRDTQDML